MKTEKQILIGLGLLAIFTIFIVLMITESVEVVDMGTGTVQQNLFANFSAFILVITMVCGFFFLISGICKLDEKVRIKIVIGICVCITALILLAPLISLI